MLYREIIAIFSEIRTKHTTGLCWKNAQLANRKLTGIYHNQEVLIGY